MEKTSNIQNEKETRANANAIAYIGPTSPAIQKIEDNRPEAKKIEMLQKMADKAVKKNPPPQPPPAKNRIGVVQGVFKINGKTYKDFKDMQSDTEVMKVLRDNNINALQAIEMAREEKVHELKSAPKPTWTTMVDALPSANSGKGGTSQEQQKLNWGTPLTIISATSSAAASGGSKETLSKNSYEFSYIDTAFNHLNETFVAKSGQPPRKLTKEIIETEIKDDQPQLKSAGKHKIPIGVGDTNKASYYIVYKVSFIEEVRYVQCFHAGPGTGT